IIPNSSVWGSSVVNYSHHATRRVDFTLGIGYDDDIEKAMQVIKKTVDADERTHKEPEPQIVVGNLGESSVDIIVRVWTDAANYWPLKFHLTRAFKQAFDDNGITIPYPQRDLHVFHKAEFPIPGMNQEKAGG
ncbi:MAG: mechanosensitive ion channel family protein, partial [Rhodovibrionaceae bacterium]|nr:mechanosensitive ion channel family protein [Rhodovibrionaceae bacterium]